MGTKVLSSELVKSFRDDGYVVLEGALSVAACKELQEVAKKHADKDFAAIINLDRKEARFRELMKLPQLVSLLEQIQGGEVVGLMSQMLFTEAGTVYAKQTWNPHQDNAYARNPNGQYVTIYLALSDQNQENGCKYVFRKSHREGLYPCEPTPSFREGPGTNPGNAIAPHILSRFEKIDVPLKIGSALIIHGDTIHGSYPNTSSVGRPMFSVSYITKGQPFVPGENAQRMEIPLH